MCEANMPLSTIRFNAIIWVTLRTVCFSTWETIYPSQKGVVAKGVLGPTKQPLCSGKSQIFRNVWSTMTCSYSRIKVALPLKIARLFPISESPGTSNVSTSVYLTWPRLDSIGLCCLASTPRKPPPCCFHRPQSPHQVDDDSGGTPQKIISKFTKPEKKTTRLGGVIPLPIHTFLGREVHSNPAIDFDMEKKGPFIRDISGWGCGKLTKQSQHLWHWWPATRLHVIESYVHSSKMWWSKASSP